MWPFSGGKAYLGLISTLPTYSKPVHFGGQLEGNIARFLCELGIWEEQIAGVIEVINDIQLALIPVFGGGPSYFLFCLLFHMQNTD